MPITYSQVMAGTETLLTTNERDPAITEYFKYQSPAQQGNSGNFARMINMFARKRPIFETTFRWQQDDHVPRKTTVNGAIASTVTKDIVVATGTAIYFRPNQVVKNLNTGEQMLVESINNSTHTITVKRGWTTSATAGEGPAVNIGNGDVLFLLGMVVAEGSKRVSQVVTIPEEISNNKANWRESWHATEEKMRQVTLGAGARKRDFVRYIELQALERMKFGIEGQILLGAPQKDTVTDPDNEPMLTTGGLSYLIRTHSGVYYNPGGVLTESNFIASVIEPLTDFLPGGRWLLLVGTKVKSAFNGFAGSTGNFVERRINMAGDRRTDIVLNIRSYAYGGSVFDIMEHPMLNARYGHADKAFAINMDDLTLAEFMAFKRRVDEQDNDELAIRGSYVYQAGLQLGNIRTHAYLAGITG